MCGGPGVGFAAAGSVLVVVGAIAVVLLALIAGGVYLLLQHLRSRRTHPR